MEPSLPELRKSPRLGSLGHQLVGEQPEEAICWDQSLRGQGRNALMEGGEGGSAGWSRSRAWLAGKLDFVEIWA